MNLRQMLRQAKASVRAYEAFTDDAMDLTGHRYGDHGRSADDVVAAYMEEHHGGPDTESFGGHHYRLLRAVARRTMGVDAEPEPEPNWKVCRVCEERKPSEHFCERGGGKYGLRNVCGSCEQDRRRAAVEAKRESDGRAA